MKTVKFNSPKVPKPHKDIIPVKYRLEEPKTRENITYTVPPGRVRRLIGRLAKTDIVPINDGKFIFKLKESLIAEYDKECDVRMKNREKAENERIRKLCINGEMEPPEEMLEDLKNNPIYRINRTIAAVKEKILSKDKKSGGFSKMQVRPLTPVEPFAVEYKNYFLRRHLYGSAEPGKSSMSMGGGRPSQGPHVLTDGGASIVESQKTSAVKSTESNDKMEETTSVLRKVGKGHGVAFTSSKSGQVMIPETSQKSRVEVGKNVKTSFEKEPIEPIVKTSSKVEQIQQAKEESSKQEEKVEEESFENVEEIDEEGAEKDSETVAFIKPSMAIIHTRPDELAPFKPFVSDLVSHVNEETEPLNMFGAGSDVLQTFTRQAKAAEQLIKNKQRADKNIPSPDMP